MSWRISYVQHGRRHGPGGSDPVIGIGGIQYVTDNEGEWFSLTTNYSFTAPGIGDAGAVIRDTSGSGAFLQCDDDVGNAYVAVLSTGVSVYVDGVQLFFLDADGTLHLKAGSSIVTDL